MPLFNTLPSANQRFKIAMVAACPFPYPRGTPIRIFRMAEILGQRGHDVHVVTYHLGEKVPDIPVKIHRIPEVRTYQKLSPGPTYQKLLVLDVLLARKLVQILQKQEIDLIHAHHYEGFLISALVRRYTKHPLIYDAHTLLGSELPFYRLGLSKRIKKRMGHYLDCLLPKQADHIITVTEEIRRVLTQEAGIKPDNITVVPNGVESEHFINLTFSDQIQSCSKKKTIIFTGNFAPYQGIDLLLKAVQFVVHKRRDIRLLLVSDSPFHPYETLASSLKIREYIDVIQTDFPKLPQLLARGDIAVNPRIECDGIPQKLLNYMAAGKPIVSFAGSAKTLHHGQTGLVVENGNVQAFADAILQLLEDPIRAHTLGRNAQQHVLAEYTWQSMAEKIEEVYRKINK